MAVVLVWASGALAGGSFSTEENLMPLLNQQPKLKAWLLGALELDELGSANRIGNNVNPRLGGLRVGPYVVLAKPKGAPGDFTLELTFNTEISCLNAAGKPTDLDKAHKVTEQLIDVQIRQNEN